MRVRSASCRFTSGPYRTRRSCVCHAHLLRAQLLLMRLGEITHAVEGEGHTRHVARMHRGTEAFLRVAPVNPARCEPGLIGGLVIMKHAFRSVENLALADAKARKLLDHVVEVARGGLV